MDTNILESCLIVQVQSVDAFGILHLSYYPSFTVHLHLEANQCASHAERKHLTDSVKAQVLWMGSTFKYPTPSIQAFRSTWARYGGEESVDFLTWLNNPRYRSVIVNYWERHQTSHHHIREKTRGNLSARGEMRMGRRREPNKNSSTNNSISSQIKFTSLSN